MKSKTIRALLIAFSIMGCDRASQDTASVETTIVMNELPPVLDAHDHGTHGPHGGELIELGNDTFHGELVHNRSGVDVYVLDGSATESVSITADKLIISLKHDGQVRAFDLMAAPVERDPPGKSSRFSSSDSTLATWIDAGAAGAVVIQIENKSYTGMIAHHHDHGEHAGHHH